MASTWQVSIWFWVSKKQMNGCKESSTTELRRATTTGQVRLDLDKWSRPFWRSVFGQMPPETNLTVYPWTSVAIHRRSWRPLSDRGVSPGKTVIRSGNCFLG